MNSASGQSFVCDGPIGPQGADGVPCADCVGRGSINGAEVGLYQVPTYCIGAGSLTFNTTCTTAICGTVAAGAFNCAGFCITLGTQQTCANSLRGYLISPTSGTF